METKLDKPNKQIQLTSQSSVTEPIVVNQPKPDVDLDIDTDEDILEQLDDDEVDNTEEEPEDAVEPDEDSEQEEEQPKAKDKPALSKEQKRIIELKREAKRLQQEKEEAERKLAERESSNTQEESLYNKYLEEYDEKEARRRAKDDIKQSNLERQVEALMFEKKNRKVLSQYPEADADLEKIMKASQTSGMTVEQVCRGLYGNVRTEKELRALKALTEESDDSEVNDSVSRAMRTAKPNTKKASLTPEQQAIKRRIDLLAKKNGVKPPTNEEFLASIYE